MTTNLFSSFLSKLSFRAILLIALFFRMLAVFFSPGFAFVDDHLEVVELAQQLLDGIDVLGNEVYIFNLIYPIINEGIFALCESVGIVDPTFKMWFVRFFHAMVSMGTVYYGYKLTFAISGKTTATIVGLLLATFWIMPFMSVRCLREFICITPLMAASYYLYTGPNAAKNLFLAGCFLGMALVFRMQTVFFPIGIGLVMLFEQRWKSLIYLTIFTLLFISLTQFLFDFYYWGDPLASLKAYFEYNAKVAGTDAYPLGPWYMYILTVLGISLPIFSVFLLWGYVKSFSIYKELFVGSLLFFLFHSYFPNKQERFILPFFPFFLLLGIIGIQALRNENNRWFRSGVFNFSVWFFVIINTIAVCVLSVTYSKKSRVEALYYFYDHKDVTNVLMANDGGVPFPPEFYCGRYMNYYKMEGNTPIEEIQSATKGVLPEYIILTGDNNRDKTLQKLLTMYKSITLQTQFEPSFVDMIAYRLNPRHNVNETWYIYKGISY